jgi:hypothetical protein
MTHHHLLLASEAASQPKCKKSRRDGIRWTGSFELFDFNRKRFFKIVASQGDSGWRIDSKLDSDPSCSHCPDPIPKRLPKMDIPGCELFKQSRTLLVVSHTNVAVDEALHRIAQLCDTRFKEGEIIRIGEPVKAELAKQEDLICQRIAAKRSEELKKKKEALEQEREAGMIELKELERLTTAVEWAEEAEDDLRDFRDGLASLTELEMKGAATSDKLTSGNAERSAWETRKRAATDAQLELDRRAGAMRQQADSTEAQARIEIRRADL